MSAASSKTGELTCCIEARLASQSYSDLCNLYINVTQIKQFVRTSAEHTPVYLLAAASDEDLALEPATANVRLMNTLMLCCNW